MVTNVLYPEWNIWSQFLFETSNGLQMDALEKSHPIEARTLQMVLLSFFYLI